MKRVLSVVLALILILTTFAACGKKKSDGTDMKAVVDNYISIGRVKNLS